MPNSLRSLQSPETKDIVAPSGSDTAKVYKKNRIAKKIWKNNTNAD